VEVEGKVFLNKNKGLLGGVLESTVTVEVGDMDEQEVNSEIRLDRRPTFEGHEALEEKFCTERGLLDFGLEVPTQELLEGLYMVEVDEKEKFLEFALAKLLTIDVQFDKLAYVSDIHQAHPRVLGVEICHLLKLPEQSERHYAIHLCLIRGARSHVEMEEQYRVTQYILRNSPFTAGLPNVHGETPLHLLCSHCLLSPNLLKLVLRAAPYSTQQKTRSGRLPLHVLMMPSVFHQPHHCSASVEAVCALLVVHPTAAYEEISQVRTRFALRDEDGSSFTPVTEETQWSPFSRAEEQHFDWFLHILRRELLKVVNYHLLVRPIQVK